MRKKKRAIRLTGIVLAVIMIFTMLPISELTAEGNENTDSPVTLSWKPVSENYSVGETGSISLSAKMTAEAEEEPVIVSVSLDKQEAEMLEDFRNDDGSLAERVTADSGQTLTLAQQTDGGYLLSFSLDGEQPELTQSLAISILPDHRTLSRTLEVAEDDVSVTVNGEPVNAVVETGSVSFRSPFGWEVSVDSAGDVLLAEGQSLTDYSVRLTAAPVEDEGRLYTESQEIHMVFTLPEGLSLPEGEYVFDPAAGAVRAGDAEILTVAGLWENAQAQVSRTGSQTLELSLSREQADENTDLSGADLSLRLKGAALQVDLTALGENAQIALNGTVVSDAAGTEDTQEFSASSVISAADTGDSETEMPQEDRQTAEDTEADRTESTRTDSSGESGKIVVETWERLESRNVFWIDNNDEEGKRLQPEEFVPELYFKVDNEEPVKLTADNLDQTGLTQMPEVSVTAVGSGQYRVSADTDLPTRISCRDEYGDLTAGYPKNISWSLNAPDADGYSFREITDENKDDYPSAGETGWYYILYDNFTISITLRSGSFVPDQGGIERAILDHFVLYTRSGGSETYLKLADLADRFVIQVGEDGNTGTITIRDLWRYNMDGTPIIYKVHEADGSADLKVEGMEEGDFYQIVYDNTSVPNYGADTSAVYSGGTIYLVLTGTTDYTATKEWLDSGDTANRPTGELQLWRYREGASYSTAAPVRGSDGSILTVGLDGNDPQSIHFPAESAVVDGETGALPKYDAEGYRYIYVIREYLDGVNQDGQSSDSYEQVYGQVKEDGTVTDTLPSGTVRTSGNTFIYDGGTISNRIQGTVQTSVTKTWEASAFQTEFHDVSVELTLQSRPAGSTDETAWKDVTGSDGKAVTVRMDNFYAESLQASVERNLSKYDALGRELAYRWVETGVYQGEDSEENLLNEDHTFVLKQSGRDIRYLSEASYSEDGLSTSIVNRIANTIDYDIIKIWRDENGEDTLPPEGTTVSFVIYQTLSGETLTDDKIVAEVTMDGVPDEEAVLVNEKLGLTFRETEPWIGKVDFLPEFNEGGAQYEYTLLESGGADHYFPTYETTQSPEDYGYDTTVINAPGDGNRILVRKDWVDDSDVEHRGEITVGVFRRSDGRKVGETTLGDGVWTDWVGIGNLDPEDVYILETEAETDRVYETNAQKLDKDAPEDAVPETHTFETDNHSYEVTYREAMRVQNDVMYSVQNRRLGNINFTVTKTWLDGDGEVRDQLEEALDRLPEEEKITPALRLEFAEEDAQQAGYEISYSGVAQPDTITLGGSHVQIEDQEGNPVSSVQAIDLNGDSSEYYFFNLPKYDTGGDIAHYTVREVWVEEASGQILTLSDLAGSEYQEIYDIVREYQISYGEETYTVSEKHERDTQTLEVINRLSGSKTLTWNKEWNDAYNVKNNIRPDIYLDIYRVVHTGKDTERTELYLANYKWTAAEADTSYDWQVEISGAPKYDDYGYEIIYYAVEKTSVEASDFDYVDTEYRLEGKDNGQTTDLGTEYDPANGAEENEYVIDIQDVKDDDSETETHYALREEGTFVNNIRNSVTIRGYKLWTNLPARYNPENLPGVIFSLMRSTDGGEAEEVATLTIENWAEIAVNGRYVIGFDYEGENTLAVENGQTVITGNGDLLDKYDEAGNLYSYTVQEKEILWKDGMEPEESDGNPVFVISADENTYQLINGYEGVPGKITVKKLLQLPMNDNGAEAYPAVTFRLTRTFTENDGTTSNPETVSEKTIS